MSKTPLINQGNASEKRAEIKQHFISTYETYESLFKCLKSESAFYLKPEPLRHPLIFYYAHTAVFFVNKLRVAKIISNNINEDIESMMAIGVDEMSWDDLNDANYDWPSVQEVQTYRDQVKSMVLALIDELDLSLPINWEDPFWIILMGIEHERIHLETSSVLIRQMDIQHVVSHSDWPHSNVDHDVVTNSLQSIPGGTVIQGRSLPSETYGWDNEYGQQSTEVKDFKTSQYLVSNHEFKAFVDDGGYLDEQWWTDEGWQWCQFKPAKQPTFWVNRDGNWLYRCMTTEIEMPWSWPVDVNYLEAKAFCNWLSARNGKSIRLPTEAEWYRIHEHTMSDQTPYPQWQQTPANIDLSVAASSVPVDKFTFGQQKLGDVIGNVWQWTETAIDGFKGFKVHPAYDDFSVPTFDGQHNLIKGGSWASTGNEVHTDSRYAFRRHFFQHAGFRYVESEQQVDQTFNTYETDELIAQYLEFHYGAAYFGVPNFPKACIDALIPHVDLSHNQRALDLGCAVGRSTFELARYYDHVDGLDFSTRFIRNAINLVEHGEVKYMIPTEGELTELKSFSLADLALGDKANNTEFAQGDACNLKPKYSNYDLIFAGNLIDRLYQPKQFLESITERLNSKGYLVITSPYTWLEEFTQKENWLGGVKVNGENYTTLDALRDALRDDFEMIAVPQDVPFVIRETARKHQHTVAQLTIWRKKA
ncbi:5-histidylcysteine sulfoxide synthase [Marinicella sp. S1101]|uniref:5-histidylcysteine sulfoxide synthase n=1 Tax=Marinicella marina TaxID=2996016 RepID=UPI0024BCAF29|nr:5-histidylcysteine sulfoxide synthase [Marinicella marina]MCX7553805.1 5-histidylcysteine sulfoxide synthase [Marinicella marina]MDJ1140881.1 5-histidylcysteine sulfoxide synthase [Marinicella marina]